MKNDLSKSEALLLAVELDVAPPITLKSRCVATFTDHEDFLDTMADLVSRELVEAVFGGWHGMTGTRHVYRLTEAGQRRKDSIDTRKRNQELFHDAA